MSLPSRASRRRTASFYSILTSRAAREASMRFERERRSRLESDQLRSVQVVRCMCRDRQQMANTLHFQAESSGGSQLFGALQPVGVVKSSICIAKPVQLPTGWQWSSPSNTLEDMGVGLELRLELQVGTERKTISSLCD